ncbi:DUF6156 family protein [Acidocella sp.]|uniref:DUF6156 family protein n=1 Tax=Acidocella sp. TaxID=50710 RepID=UPI003D01FAC8
MPVLVEVVPAARACRYFVTYAAIGLPFRLIGPIEGEQALNRNTFIRAWFDDGERLIGFDKLVHADVELSHRYFYDEDGALLSALVTMAGEAPVRVTLPEIGAE